ncbi:MAG: esterase family protein [Chitinophagaceae bacterium]|nr:esterase family protein [Chitinophagaceae bacterium]
MQISQSLRLCIGLLLLFSTQLQARQSGKVLESRTLNSAILGKAVRYTIYLPADYESSERYYPVVYLLHGYTDNDMGWLQFGEINRYADKAIAEGAIPPMIIVMPNADSSFYINSFDGKQQYEDFFITEFIPGIEKKYRIRSAKQFRGVAGLSMGGYGTLIYSLKHPDMFAAAAPLSAAVFDDSTIVNMSQQGWNVPLGRVYGTDLKGKQRLTSTWYENSILKIVERKSAAELKKVRYWIDCGDDDFLIKGNCLLHIALTEKQVPHEFRVRDGVHDWNYWRSGIVEALQFIGKSFHQ